MRAVDRDCLGNIVLLLLPLLLLLLLLVAASHPAQCQLASLLPGGAAPASDVTVGHKVCHGKARRSGMLV
jgi:hypothetical protein